MLKVGLKVQLMFVWLGDCFWSVGCLAVWLLVVGCLLVHWCCKVTSKHCLTTLCGFDGASIVWLVCWLFVCLALVCWLLVCWLFVGRLVVGWVFDCWLGLLIVCWLFVFLLGCCCIRQAVLEVGLKVQVALWPTWALPASPLRRNTRLTWSPTTSLVFVFANMCFLLLLFTCSAPPTSHLGRNKRLFYNHHHHQAADVQNHPECLQERYFFWSLAQRDGCMFQICICPIPGCGRCAGKAVWHRHHSTYESDQCMHHQPTKAQEPTQTFC